MTLKTATQAINTLADDLGRAFIERSDVIRALLIAILAREHVALLGDPGTAKSAVVNTLCRAIGGTYFQVLMSKFSVPEELFGPISLIGMESDTYRRITRGYLPSAHVAFLDEIFKANTAILNAMLTITNEREYDNAGQREKVPLEILVGASNEMPEDGLNAMWDRFMLRIWVNPIKNRDNMRSLLKMKGEPAITTMLTTDDLATLRAAVGAVVLPDDVLDTVLDLRDALAREHGIAASDRRWRKCMKLICAAAVLDGRTIAEPNDVLVLVDALWRQPEERAKVYGTIARIVCPELAMSLQLLDAATEIFGSINLETAQVADTRNGNATVPGLGSVNDKLKNILGESRKLNQAGPVAGVTAQILRMATDVQRAARSRLSI